MYKILCYSYREALKEAREFVEGTDYTICKKKGVLNNVGTVGMSDEMDRRFPDGCSGEVQCVCIEDNNHNTIAKIGYWCEESYDEACGIK